MPSHHRLVIALLASAFTFGCAPSDPTTPPTSTTTTSPVPDTPPRDQVTVDDVTRKSKEALHLSRELAARTRDEFVAEAKERLAEMNRQLDEWEARSEPLADEARARWNARREEFRQRRDELQEELKKLDAASAGAWDDLKAGASRAWQNLADSFRQAGEHFDSERPSGNPP